MSKAKYLVITIFLLTILGGVMAFNTSRLNHPFFKNDAACRCIVPAVATYTTDPALAIGQITTISSLNTFSHIGCCTTIFVYPAL
ncbi:hypothetical protein SAMN05428988_3191 [Chitinophaga sp. YR573]|uniref:hypothetical protein n=1 Tax=Chitinophaga sp. YR573 TaxID=1881040 RepID=UPI0008C59D79|nr:hypothetical protein [Chitinophaga sp. YR573]SEW21264.1 hypothetical protein SAMN05428988_3191 [Chitinophaga sp. YR573]